MILSDAEQVIELWQQGWLSFRAMRMVLFPPADRMALNPLNQHYNMWTAEELLPDFSALGFEAHTFDAGAWSYDLVDELYPEETKQYWGTPIMNLGVVAVKRE